MAMRITY